MRTLLFFLSALLLRCGTAPGPSMAPALYRLAGGPCEGCEAVLEARGQTLRATDTLPGFSVAARKLYLTGTIFRPDGKTPAEGVILYIYHTNAAGIYAPGPSPTTWERRHGALRGWVKTGKDGRYHFYTQVPGIYPDRGAAAHIHPTVLEPDGRYYYLTDYFFAGDSLLTAADLNPSSPRGGNNGVLALQEENGLLVGRRNLVLGKGIPGYEE
jgi:protocatechuate 3,4-dioxygenase beta subunit